MTDTAGQIIMANCEALRILEPAELFLRRMTCNMLFGEGVDCPHTTLSKERSLTEREIPSRAGDRLLNIRASSLSDSNGRVRGFLHSIKVTRERVPERQLIEAGRLSLAAMTASSVECSMDTTLIWGDRAQLRQVLLSVIATASQAMKNGGLLRVRICEGAVLNMPRPSVLITVEETGQGEHAPAIERVFDNFFTTKTSERGREPGLVISKRIIERHGGAIRAEKADGGARFSISLPALIR
jgi:C4-dicarboxylate-specific signal transduction histidine kinase